MKSTILGMFFLAMALTAKAADLTTVWGARASFQVTFQVVDDEGRAVEGAMLGCGWGRLGFSAPDVGQANLLTSADGKGVVSGRSVFNEFNYHAEKLGYYAARSVGYDKQLFRERVDDRWEPWNPTIKLVVKRIRNPVPMYVKRLAASLPALNTPVGYDLEVGDWVAPYGKGHAADLVFAGRLEQRGDRDFDWKLKVSFSHPGDGLQRFDGESNAGGGELRSPYEAPADGYVPEWTLIRSRRTESAEQSTFKPDGAYFFRIRTELDAQGKVVKAWYGKIYGDFFDMVYYLNPDGTRNVEFDPKRNLFKPAKPDDSAFWNLRP